MWMVVMFDLPVMEKAERKAATQFRNGLLDLGFEMGGFKYEVQHGLTRRETPRGVS